MINIFLSIKNYIELYHEKKTIYSKYIFFDICCLDLFVLDCRYVANAIVTTRLDYAFRDWPMFFVNNLLIKP